MNEDTKEKAKLAATVAAGIPLGIIGSIISLAFIGLIILFYVLMFEGCRAFLR